MSIHTNNITLCLLIAFLSGCSEKNTPQDTKVQADKKQEVIERKIDPIQYSRGSRLYQLNCAICHGKNAEGASNWRKTDDDGKFPAPPLNGTGHTWHHSTKVLVDTIKNGTAKLGGNMPAWKGKLSDQEISDILTWVKAQWPDEIYTAWYNNFHQKK